MKKRILSLLLVLSFLLPMFPMVRAEEQTAEADIEALVAEQFDAFAKSLKPEGASEGAAQLVKHSIKGGGDLNMDEDDKFTKSIMNTGLMRIFFVHTATKVHQSAHSIFEGDTVYMRGTCRWYQNHLEYTTRAFHDNENSDKYDDEEIFPRFSVNTSMYEGNLETKVNTYDEAMMLVSGDTRVWFTFRPAEVTDTTVRYRVTIKAYDSFDFNTKEYSGSDRGLEEFLAWAGSFLSLGLLTTFEWTATAEFDLELPNFCSHSTNTFRWEFDGNEDLMTVADGENTPNPLKKTSGYLNEKGAFRLTRYISEIPMNLYHDLPWTIEFRCMGSGSFALADYPHISDGTHLRKTSNTVFFGEKVFLNETDEEATLTQYGLKFTDGTGLSSKDFHTYTLSNQVNDDGSNMVYLYVDGVCIGPMDGYYHNGESQHSNQDWVSGRDFIYRYIGTRDRPIEYITMEYLQIWENGKGNEPFSYLTTSPAVPTCTADGGTLNTCSLCGAEFLTDVIPATGHDYTDWQTVLEPTCTVEGRMERSCRTCGHRDSRPIAVTAHSYAPVLTDPTCIEPGFTTYICICGDSYVADHTEALGHDLTEWTVTEEPTCLLSGTEEQWCQRCGLRESRSVDSLGHDYESEVIEPGCTVGGYTLHTCTRCEISYRSDFTSPTGHSYEPEITPATCTEGGFTTFLCACGYSYRSNFTVPLGHELGEWTTVTPPTCTENGSESRSCSRCDYSETRTTNATGHNHNGIVTAPTCTEQGFTTYLCICGDFYISDYTDALGHDYADGICNRCGAEDPDYEEPVVNPFTDVPGDSFYFEPVLWAVKNSITSGTTSATFSPNDSCMRAHVVTFLWRAAGSPAPESDNNPFVDVKESDFYYNAVLWAVEKGITTGADATHFNPFGICNRAQVVTFLHRAFGSPAAENADNPFTDVPAESWYTAPVLWAVEHGITNGLSADAFGPDSPCNRAQVVTFLYRAYN